MGQRRAEMNLDYNCNYDPNKPRKYYTTITKTFKVPNILLTKYPDATARTNFSPASRKRGFPPRKPPAPQKPMAELRREKIKFSNETLPGSRSSSSEEMNAKRPNFTRQNVQSQTHQSATRSADLPQVVTVKKQPLVGSRPLRPEHMIARPNPEHRVVPSLMYQSVTKNPDVQKMLTFKKDRAQDEPITYKLGTCKKNSQTIDWEGWKVLETNMSKLDLCPPTLRGRFQPKPDQCCCQRPKKTVMCSMCGFRVRGNVKTTCAQHPLNIFLYDWEVCGNPKCKAPRLLVELDD